jgi:putative membrane protein
LCCHDQKINPGDRALVGCLAIAPVWAQNKDRDQHFLQNAIEGNLTEIQLGKMAEQNASTEAGRSFGQMLANDHSKNNEKATQVAHALKVSVPTEPNAKQRQMIREFSQLSGRSFDRELAQHMVTDHKKDIRDFEQAAKSQDEQVADYAKDTLPTLRKHLDTAEALANRIATR